MTRFHELAHVLLGHTTEGEYNDGAPTPRNLGECRSQMLTEYEVTARLAGRAFKVTFCDLERSTSRRRTRGA
jgi:hypothetical protein